MTHFKIFLFSRKAYKLLNGFASNYGKVILFV